MSQLGNNQFDHWKDIESLQFLKNLRRFFWWGGKI
jgi:hypothetical protein